MRSLLEVDNNYLYMYSISIKQLTIKQKTIKLKIMKKAIFSLSIMFLFGTMTLFSQEKNEKFEVKGNCGMCEKTIETAAKSVDGVMSADWSQETKIMTLSYDESKTDVKKVQMAIANAGYDTPMHKAKDEVYSKLPGCCKYDRSEEKE